MMENGVDKRAGSAGYRPSTLVGSHSKPDVYRTMVDDASKSERRNIRDTSLEWITDAKTGAETAYGLGGFRYRIYTTPELGTCCMYMWPGHSITTSYGSHEEGKQAMNDHHEAIWHTRDEALRELHKENEGLKRRIQLISSRVPQS
jgi:hypothetical protein